MRIQTSQANCETLRKKVNRPFPVKQVLLSLLLTLSCTVNAHSQTLELIGGNSVNGAVTGSILGAAVMGLTDNNDLTAIKIGAGAGIISGVAIAIHDIAVLPKGQRFYISGTFNDGTNSSIIILLDTFYGVVTGAVTGTAAMLVSDRPILDGMQYGAGAGAWAGFAFGLADAFIFGRRNEDFISTVKQSDGSLLSVQHLGVRMNLIRAGIVSEKRVSDSDIYRTHKPALQFLNIHVPIR